LVLVEVEVRDEGRPRRRVDRVDHYEIYQTGARGATGNRPGERLRAGRGNWREGRVVMDGGLLRDTEVVFFLQRGRHRRDFAAQSALMVGKGKETDGSSAGGTAGGGGWIGWRQPSGGAEPIGDLQRDGGGSDRCEQFCLIREIQYDGSKPKIDGSETSARFRRFERSGHGARKDPQNCPLKTPLAFFWERKKSRKLQRGKTSHANCIDVACSLSLEADPEAHRYSACAAWTTLPPCPPPSLVFPSSIRPAFFPADLADLSFSSRPTAEFSCRCPLNSTHDRFPRPRTMRRRHTRNHLAQRRSLTSRPVDCISVYPCRSCQQFPLRRGKDPYAACLFLPPQPNLPNPNPRPVARDLLFPPAAR
jgi:hypothetical protein